MLVMTGSSAFADDDTERATTPLVAGRYDIFPQNLLTPLP
jgi:hypothetical protein